MMASRLARIFFLALATALLIYYHSAFLAWTGFSRESPGETTTVIQWPIPPKPPSGAFKDPIPDPKPAAQDNAASDDSASAFNEVKFPFQEDLMQYRPPKIPISTLTKYAPHNDHGSGQFAYATYLSTRNNSIHDPYFLSAQQLVYRLLWDPVSRSAFHPVVVFVAPFIPDEQRDILRAQGAIVRELELVPWDPPKNEDGDIFPFARWRDLFSKLNIWAQTDFSRIVFLDLDAFPVQNLDAIFEESVAPRQKCKTALLPAADKAYAKEICDYVWAGTGGQGGINVGVVVLEPNKYMHARLMRESQDTTKFDNKMAEQAFLNYAFDEAGPFPPTDLGREWNGYWPKPEDEGKIKIVHEKLWIVGEGWTKDIFSKGWTEILELYESERFVEMRKLDGALKTGFF
ncbi:hypothetical protein N0V82_009795 [Gnomoniopsis sp. IMI 355080]|nr:hypothetical protein N0V82_009795 [Gnomoniopsis sp. IMI 355080]